MKQDSRAVKATDKVPLNIVTVKHNESQFQLADAGTWPAFIQLLLYPKPLGREQFFPFRILLLIAMIFFTIQLMLNGYDAWIAQYLHCLNLPVHEFGHIVFAIFGNAVIHSLGGKLVFDVDAEGVTLISADKGPGIPDIELAMKEGFSTANDEARSLGFGAGMGLPNMKRNADEFDIQSEPGDGTTITMRFHLK